MLEQIFYDSIRSAVKSLERIAVALEEGNKLAAQALKMDEIRNTPRAMAYWPLKDLTKKTE